MDKTEILARAQQPWARVFDAVFQGYFLTAGVAWTLWYFFHITLAACIVIGLALGGYTAWATYHNAGVRRG